MRALEILFLRWNDKRELESSLFSSTWMWSVTCVWNRNPAWPKGEVNILCVGFHAGSLWRERMDQYFLSRLSCSSLCWGTNQSVSRVMRNFDMIKITKGNVSEYGLPMLLLGCGIREEWGVLKEMNRRYIVGRVQKGHGSGFLHTSSPQTKPTDFLCYQSTIFSPTPLPNFSFSALSIPKSLPPASTAFKTAFRVISPRTRPPTLHPVNRHDPRVMHFPIF